MIDSRLHLRNFQNIHKYYQRNDRRMLEFASEVATIALKRVDYEVNPSRDSDEYSLSFT